MADIIHNVNKWMLALEPSECALIMSWDGGTNDVETGEQLTRFDRYMQARVEAMNQLVPSGMTIEERIPIGDISHEYIARIDDLSKEMNAMVKVRPGKHRASDVIKWPSA